jgi:hypothetical protein
MIVSRFRSLALASLGMTLVFAGRAGAQTNVATIDPGMTREQVVAKLGEPLSSRSFNSVTYLFYKNGCEKTCGMNDLVTLDSGKVIDAVFRSPGRKYTGTSSSPRMISMAEAAKGTEVPKPALKKPEPPKPEVKKAEPKKAEPKKAEPKKPDAKKDSVKKAAPAKTPPPTPKKP